MAASGGLQLQGFHPPQAEVELPTDFPGAKLIHLHVDPVMKIEEASEVIVTKIVLADEFSTDAVDLQ